MYKYKLLKKLATTGCCGVCECETKKMFSIPKNAGKCFKKKMYVTARKCFKKKMYVTALRNDRKKCW